MGTSHLIDSNVIIELFNGKMSPTALDFMRKILNSSPQTSVVTEMEVLGFKNESGLQLLLESFFQDCRVIPLSRSIVESTISIRKNHKIKLPDAIIAATALVHNLTIITRNSSDFEKIDALKWVNPHEM